MSNHHDGAPPTVSKVILDAQSGLAGNLLAAALVRAGVHAGAIDAVPKMLALAGFSVAWDNHGVCDGYGGSFSGTVGELTAQMAERLPGRVAECSCAAVRLALPAGLVQDHTACDTAFDTTAFFLGLEMLGWPEVLVAGPLPTTAKDHPTSRRLLSAWAWVPVSCDLELVTPTAAALLSVSNAQQVDVVPRNAVLAGEVHGRFALRIGLPPVRVWVTPD